MAFFTPLGNLFDTTGEAGLAHGQGMQRDVGTAPGVAGRGEIVGVDLTLDLENFDGDRFGDFSLVGKPLGVRPGLNNLLGCSIALGKINHLLGSIIDIGHTGESAGGFFSKSCIAQGINQWLDVIATNHGPKNLNGLGLVNQR